jgi:hypothetical protein
LTFENVLFVTGLVGNPIFVAETFELVVPGEGGWERNLCYITPCAGLVKRE